VLRSYAVPTLIGGLWALLAWLLIPTLLPWLAPVLLGLVLAVPLALLSGRADLGRAAARRGWFLIPEEVEPPRELAWLGPRAAAPSAPSAAPDLAAAA
jgi:membrane glycosyltransferase